MTRGAALVWGLIWLLLLAGADGFLLSRTAVLRYHLDQVLWEAFGSEVDYGGFQGSFPGDLVLRAVRLRNPATPGTPLARVPELHLEMNWSALLTGRPPVERAVLKRPQLLLSWDRNGRLRLESPLRAPTAGPPSLSDLPGVEVRGLRLHLVDAPYLLRPQARLDLRSLHVSLDPDFLAPGRYRFSGVLDEPALGRVSATGTLTPRHICVDLERRSLELGPAMREQLVPGAREILERMSVDGDVDLLATFRHGGDEPGAPFRIQAHFDGVGVRYKGVPFELEDLGGTVTYARGRFRSRGLAAHVAGGVVKLDEGLVDLRGDSPGLLVKARVLGLDISAGLVRRMEALGGVGPQIARQLRKWELRGPVDLDVKLERRAGPQQPVRPRLVADLRDARFAFRGDPVPGQDRHRGFPYPLEQVRGRVEIDDLGLRLEGVTALNGLTSVQASGFVDYSRESGDVYDVRITVNGLELDEELMRALPPGVRQVLASLKVAGRVDGWVHPVRPPGSPEPDLPDMTVILRGLELEPEAFPYLIDGVQGVVRHAGGVISLEDVRGRHGPARVSLDGRIRLEDGAYNAVVGVKARDVPVDADLLRGLEAVSPDVAALLRRLEIQGHLSLKNLEIVLSSSSTGAGVSGSVRLDGMRIVSEEPALDVEVIRGGVTFGPRGMQVLPRTEIAVNGVRLEVSGAMGSDQAFQVHLQAEGLPVDAVLLEALAPWVAVLGKPGDWSGLAGSADLALEVAGEEEVSTAHLSLTLREVAAKPPGWSWSRIADLGCHLELDLLEHTLSLDGLLAFLPWPEGGMEAPGAGELAGREPFAGRRGTTLRVGSGTLHLDRDGLQGLLDGVTVEGLVLHPWLVEISGGGRPEQRAWEALNVSGLADLDVRTVSLAAEEVTVSAALAHLRDLQYGPAGGITLEEADIEDLSLVYGPGLGLRVEAGLIGRNLRVFGVPVPVLRTTITGSSEGLSLQPIEGVLFGRTPGGGPLGIISGERSRLGLDWSGRRFELVAHLTHMDLAATVRALGGSPGGVIGSGDLGVELRGIQGRPETYRGSGSLRAKATNLVEIPLFLRILQVAELRPESLLNTRTHTRVEADFALEQRVVRLHHAALKTPNVDLEGSGVVTLDGTIRAHLDAEHHGSIPLLSQVLGLFQSALLGGLEVVGPLEDPEVRATSFGGGGSRGLPKGRRPRTHPPRW